MNSQTKKYRTFGVMIDLSRNAVMTPKRLKEFLLLLSRMGYNMAMLYTEDTYEIKGEDYFGYMRARYSEEELRDLDSYALSIGIELIPCIQTLAHLATTLRWGKIPAEDADCMLADDERTYEMIGKMLDVSKRCFTSRRIHIGMDEAGGIGRGRHLDIHGYEDPMQIIKRHLTRVEKMVTDRGLTPLIWSDMFFRPWNNGHYEEAMEKCTVPSDVIESVPKNTELVYWAYSNDWQNIYDDMLYNHKQITDKIWFAGGAWGWIGITPNNSYSVNTMKTAFDACERYGIRDVFITMWGNNGADGSRFAQLPALYHIIKYAEGVHDDEEIKRGFKETVGVDYDVFMTLDLPNQVGSPEIGTHRNNPAHYMLYSDPLNGYLDYTVRDGGSEEYRKYAEILRDSMSRAGEYAYLFETEAYLCDALAVKYELGVRLRRAYQSADREELRRIAQEIPGCIASLRELLRADRRQWYHDNKPSGFEVIELRMGGVIARLEGVMIRIESYLSGEAESIDELECELLPYGKKGESMLAAGPRIYTTNAY